MPSISPKDISNLPLLDLAVRLLRDLAAGGSVNLNSLLRGMQQSSQRDRMTSTYQSGGSAPEALSDEHLARIADAWAWLESHGLLSMDHRNTPSGHWQRVTRSGRELANDPAVVSKVWAEDRLAGPLHPALSSARSNFALGDY
jgi:hypothetical protein